MPKLSPSGDLGSKRDEEAPNSFKKQGRSNPNPMPFGNSAAMPGSIGKKGNEK